MNAIARLRQWWHARTAVDDSPWDGDTSAWLVSLAMHLGVLIALTLVSLATKTPQDLLILVSNPPEPDVPLAQSEELLATELTTDEVGAAASGDAEGAISVAPVLDVTAAPATQLSVDERPNLAERIRIEDEIRRATGPRFDENLAIRGSAGVGVAGAGGATDVITREILASLEQRKVLVVWLFDQSGSLEPQRAEIIKRFDRIYEELGVLEARGNPAFKQHENKPLLTAVVAFGQNVSFLTPKPTDELDEIKSAVAAIKTDDSGIERTFGAVRQAADRFRQSGRDQRRVMFFIFTDEVGDDDEAELDTAVAVCQRRAIPVYCVGVPAPFGRREVLVKYVDPDPKFDQTPQWVPVRQGPESFRPELVKIGSNERDDPLDSGFGPYGLARLCVETGGIFFAVKPFDDRGRPSGASAVRLAGSFDPQIMTSYRPEYTSVKEYDRLLTENKARAALVQAAEMSWITPMAQPQLVFPKVNEADLANRLTMAQRAAAVLEPKIGQLYEVLRQGQQDRPRLTKLRWQAGYDLSMGLVLALKVRTEGYNAMLAKAKRGMRFDDPNNDTWRLAPSSEFSVGSTLEKQAGEAKVFLERVAKEHSGTPWAVLAEAELKHPFGWSWKEMYTGVNAPREAEPRANNNMRRTPSDEQAKMIPRPVRRPAPKL